MTLSQDASLKSPWMTIWLSPRRTIDDVLATRPRQFIWLLASLGTIASFYGQLLAFGLTSQLLDWRILLGFVVATAMFGIAWLYLAARVLGWIGKLLGGPASALELRAVLAWSTAPIILGSALILVLFAVLRVLGGESVTGTVGLSTLLPAIVAISGSWSFIILLLMLSRAERFGFLRTLALYFLGLSLPLVAALLVRTFLF
jgi:signal peptidase I